LPEGTSHCTARPGFEPCWVLFRAGAHTVTRTTVISQVAQSRAEGHRTPLWLHQKEGEMDLVLILLRNKMWSIRAPERSHDCCS
jgi:hypothetical protein